MNITIYELFRLVKDGKAPKKIKWRDTKYTLYIDEDTKQKYYQDDKCRYFFLSIKCLNDLNDTVEILGEQKEIPEKLEKYYDKNLEEYVVETYINGVYYKEIYKSRYDEMIIGKLNEIIDYIKSKGDE